jgi:hypothetical protein
MTALEARAHRIAEHYLAGASLAAAGRAEGVSTMTAMRALKTIGVDRRKPKPAPVPRECAREGCENTFKPSRRQLEQGFGKYCSNECDGLAHRKYPKPAPRVCAFEHCPREGEPFTPAADKGAQDARGWNLYCSRMCARAAQRGRRLHSTKGEWIDCDNKCGREVWRYDCELALEHSEGRFCSYACHAERRKQYPWPGYRDFFSPAASGRARQRMIGAREGRVAGGGEGRPVDARDERVIAEVLRLRAANPRLGERPIAERMGISRRRVREILSGHAA